MARDSGRYDATTDTWIDDNVRIDFAWGNIPIQPNDDREEELVYELDSHNIAIDGWAGYPQIDDLENSIIPAPRAPEDFESYSEVLAALGLVAVQGVTVENTVGAGVTGWVTSTSPAIGSLVPVGTEVTVNILGSYAVTVPSVVDFDSVSAAEAYLVSEGLVLGTVTTSSVGATLQNNNWVKSQSPAAGTSVVPGTAVNLVKYAYTAPINYSIAGIRPHADGNTRRTLYLNGRNSGITVGSMIQLSNTGVANYNRIFDVLTVENDDAFNTGGQKITITNGLMTNDGGDVTNTGTWAVYP